MARARNVLIPLVATIAVAIPVLAPGFSAGAADDQAPRAARSLLVITLPATAWIDIRDGTPPNLTRLFRRSALANLATRTVTARTAPGPGYLTMSTGARTLASADAAASQLDAREPFAGQSAAVVYNTRTGHSLHGGIGALDWPSLVARNADRSYGAKPGALGRALTEAGIGRRVIANADGRDESGPVLHREAALSLVDTHGRVPGEVSRELLRSDPTAPFGWRLDIDRVLGAFPADFSDRRQVVAVEASDLARADAYRKHSNPNQRGLTHRDALAASDAMVGRLLERVDFTRDAVMVVAPYHSSRARALTVVAIRGPGFPAGLVESGTTRRAGFLQIVDLAPTVLELLGQPRPEDMEGRGARFQSDPGTYRERLDGLVQADRAAQFRDATIGQATATLVTATIVLTVLAIGGLWWYRRRWTRVALRWASLLLLGYVTATFLARLLPTYRWGMATYVIIVVAIAIGFAATCLALGRRAIADPLMIALGLIVAMHGIDLVSGAHLELSTVFGYSPTVGIRLAGIGNPASAQLSAAALLFAILIAWRAPRHGDTVGLVLLIAVLALIGAPMWGQDFGGALALGPTIVVWWWLRSGRRMTLRAVGTIVGVLVATGLLAGFVDLSRPENQRTHVGRFFEKVGSEGMSGFLGVIGRKASLMIGTFSNTAWVLLVLSVLVGIWLAANKTDLLDRVLQRVPTMRPGLACFAVLVVLGTALNDSGVQVTGMMLATLLPVLVFLATKLDDDAPEPAPPERSGETVTTADAPVPARSPA